MTTVYVRGTGTFRLPGYTKPDGTVTNTLEEFMKARAAACGQDDDPTQHDEVRRVVTKVSDTICSRCGDRFLTDSALNDLCGDCIDAVDIDFEGDPAFNGALNRW